MFDTLVAVVTIPTLNIPIQDIIDWGIGVGSQLMPILLPIGGIFIARKFGGFIKSIF